MYIIVLQFQGLFLQKLSIFPLKITIDTYENQTSKKDFNYKLKIQINLPKTVCYSRAHFDSI